MKILWVTNIAIPEVSILMNEKPSPFGGWLINASKYLSEQDNVELSIAFPESNIKGFKKFEGEKITYYAFKPVGNKDKKIIEENPVFKEIINEVKPDILHIFGTEFPHTLSAVKTFNNPVKTVVNIQGLCSICSKHYLANLPHQIINKYTFRDLIRNDNIKKQAGKLAKRGEYEIEALKRVNHIIGRTDWDKTCTSQINPDAKYHFCNETLREEFYEHVWDINECEKHSIFVSQGSHPIKGLHFMLEALPFIISLFPDTKLYVAGNNITKSDTLKDKLKISSYGKYIKNLIEKNNLRNSIIFTGTLDEKQMCEQYLKSNVFVSASFIENSSNSLSEAKILGVPSVSSFVGGVTSLITHNVDGFAYQHDAPYMLAHYVSEIFGNDDLALSFSKKARARALITHDRATNTKRLMEIYGNI